MSQEEQDAIVGRLIRERSEALKQSVALDAEIKLVCSKCDSVLRRVHTLTAGSVSEMLEPIRKYFNIDAFCALLKDKARLQDEIREKTEQLKGLGVTE